MGPRHLGSPRPAVAGRQPWARATGGRAARAPMRGVQVAVCHSRGRPNGGFAADAGSIGHDSRPPHRRRSSTANGSARFVDAALDALGGHRTSW